MSSSWGNHLKLSIFGESHGDIVGGTLHDFPAGIYVDLDKIKLGLKLRQGSNNFTTAKKVEDRPTIISGIQNGYTTGAPITVIFSNPDANLNDFKKEVPRPSHADYVADIRYKGYADMNGGGHFSGRLTLPIVFFGMLCSSYLSSQGIDVVSHIKCIGEVYDDKFGEEFPKELIERLNSAPLATISPEARKRMVSLLMSISATGDSIGGAIETAVVGLPAGYGSPIFDNLESRLASMIFSIPAVKCVGFGYGAHFAHARGSAVADAFVLKDNGTIGTDTNFNGGLNGGISNGMPIIITTAFKPTPSIRQTQKTLNFETNKIVDWEVKRDHIECIAPRGNIIITSAVALVVMDAFLEGNGYMAIEPTLVSEAKKAEKN